jgi:hypothetical protein
MGKTYRTARPIPADLSNDQERPVRESTLRRFSKALKKFTHHRERRQATRQIREAI